MRAAPRWRGGPQINEKGEVILGADCTSCTGGGRDWESLLLRGVERTARRAAGVGAELRPLADCGAAAPTIRKNEPCPHL